MNSLSKICALSFVLLSVCSQVQTQAQAQETVACNKTTQGVNLEVLEPMIDIVISDDRPISKSRDNENLNFKVDVDYLKDGENQFGVSIEDISSFVKAQPDFKTVDFEDSLNKKKGGNYVWATRNAYILPVDPQFFSDEMVNDPKFLEKTNKDTTVVPLKDGMLEFTKTNISYGPFSRPDVTSVIKGLSYNIKKKSGNITAEQLKAINSLNPELKAKPEIVNISFTQESTDKNLIGSSTLTKYYRIGKNKTLLVSYYFLVLELGWGEKLALKTASPLIKKYAPDTTKDNIETLRKVIKEYQ